MQQNTVLSFIKSAVLRNHRRPTEDAVGAAAGGFVFVQGVAIKVRRERRAKRGRK